MQPVPINLWALLAAIVASFVVGGIWYSPLLFMRPWLAMAGVDKARFDAGLPKALIGDLIGSLILAFVLVHAIVYAGANDLGSGLFVTFWNWLGFVAVVLLGSVTYEHKPWRYYAINAGYRFVAMMVMGAILTLWR
ncbi:MAG TPA: DUF1761 domain-containing protein [Stellaceae bacterium]|jgi:Protein of unknown function (DUF1761)|nr:DUF1761 domain-containing protein [Stellaceae bacterium]